MSSDRSERDRPALPSAGRRVAARRAGVAERSLASHLAIFSAIERGDAATAREAMRRHILEFEQDVRAGLQRGTSSE